MDAARSPRVRWRAQWLWLRGTRNAVNFHFFARKAFRLSRPPRRAVLHVSVYTDYKLFVNGRYVARGPLPCDPCRPSYDSHDVTRLLARGRNAIALICHNHGVGCHWRHKGPGGLIAQLELETGRGRRTIGTDGSWRVRRAECFRPNSPRMFWSAGFMETFDFRRLEDDWLSPGCDDRAWQEPEVLGPHPTRPCETLEPREMPAGRRTRELNPANSR